MLPFLKPKNATTGIMTAYRAVAEKKHDLPIVTPELLELEAISQDLIQALFARDAKGVAQAFLAAFSCCESYPHEEAADDSSFYQGL